jgi:macrolide-specific efflux system membrane fusion protein
MAAATVSAGLWLHWGRQTNNANSVSRTARVARRDFATTVLAIGAVRPQVGSEVRVGARISGRVERLYTNVGDVVKKGQMIAELEKSDLEATVAERQAELNLALAKLSAVQAERPKEIEKAEADLKQCEATAILARKAKEREHELRKKGIASEETEDQALERCSVAEAQLSAAQKALELSNIRYVEDLKQAKAEIARARSALDSAKVQVSYATITAPISGVIASVSTQEGETVAAGLNAPTFVTILDLNRLQVDAYVDEVDIGKVRVGQKALFTVDAYPGQEFKGKVAAIYPKAVLRENVVNYDVVIEIENTGSGLLRSEMTANVTILLDARKDVLAVPGKAIKREAGKNVVYVSADGKRETRDVTVGWKDGQWIEIVSGLKEGETVFLEEAASTAPP